MRRNERFERRFYRGLEPKESTDVSDGFVDRYCDVCRAPMLEYASVEKPVCYDCNHEQNEFAAKGIRMSVDATGEDSTNPQRVREGTQIFNMALPPVVEEYGVRNAYGQRTVKKSRPVANNEIASARRLKELAKHSNLTPQDTQKRAVGSRSR